MRKLILLCSVCGGGKSTLVQYINENNLLSNYDVCEADNLGFNCHDYINSEKNLYQDCINHSLKITNKNILFGSCINPLEYYEKVKLTEEVEVHFIALICQDGEIRKRLLARDKERNCGNKEFIDSQIEYLDWFKNNLDKFDFVISTDNKSIINTSKEIIKYINKIK